MRLKSLMRFSLYRGRLPRGLLTKKFAPQGTRSKFRPPKGGMLRVCSLIKRKSSRHEVCSSEGLLTKKLALHEFPVVTRLFKRFALHMVPLSRRFALHKVPLSKRFTLRPAAL